MIVIFLLVVVFLFSTLFSAYHGHGTVFPNPISAPGIFKSPGGSWIRRNLFSAVALGSLFFSSLLFMPYAPVGLVASDSRPLLAAYHSVVEHKLSVTGLLNYLNHYEPLKAEEIVQRLATDEVRRLQSMNPVSQREYILTKQTADYLRSYPAGWVNLMLDSALIGHSQAIWALLLALLQCLLFPVVVFVLVSLAVFGQPLRNFEKAIAALKSPVNNWQGYVERLRRSEVPAAREHLWLGCHATEDYPVLLHRAILSEHAHLIGDSGSGKTALGMAPLMTQLIRDEDSAVVIIDLKGDMALFQNAREEAGARFKFFTNEVGKATHVFNPFAPLSSDHISLNQMCEVFLSAMGLDHGEGYGRSYYSRMARNLLSRTLHEYPDIATFAELREKVGKLVDTQSEEKDAFELIAVVESLASVDQLNYTARDAVGEHGIDMVRVLKEREVVYFWLPAAVEATSVREIAKLALYTLFNSAYLHQRREQQAPKVWVFIDEFQHVASLNFKLLLQQSRSLGLGMILANQSNNDLWTQDADLRGTVQTNTRFKQVFSVSNLEQREQISRASGETLYYSGRLGAAGAPDGAYERLGPRLMANDLIAFSDESETSVVFIGRGEGYSQFGGFAFPLRGDYHVTLAEYVERKQAAWPAQGAETLVARRKRRTEAGPDIPSSAAAYILSEDEPPAVVSEKVTSSPWAQHLAALYQARKALQPKGAESGICPPDA